AFVTPRVVGAPLGHDVRLSEGQNMVATGSVRILPVGHSTGLEWLWIIIPLAGLVAVISWLIMSGEPDGEHTGIPGWFARAASSLRRLSSLPPWATGGIATGAWTL